MKIMMVESRYTGKILLNKLDTAVLPDKLGIISTVQFLDYLDQFKEVLEKKGKAVFMGKELQIYDTQLLGCDQGAATAVTDQADAYIYFGTGRFHPLGVLYKTEKDVHCYDPITGVQDKLDAKDAKLHNKKRRGALLKFLDAKTVGLLVSTKPGQNQFRKALELKERLKDKKCYIFVSDTLEFNQVENFPFIECWLNTACNRIMDDGPKFPRPLVDLYDAEQYLKDL